MAENLILIKRNDEDLNRAQDEDEDKEEEPEEESSGNYQAYSYGNNKHIIRVGGEESEESHNYQTQKGRSSCKYLR